jgi:hypothetical protein
MNGHPVRQPGGGVGQVRLEDAARVWRLGAEPVTGFDALDDSCGLEAVGHQWLLQSSTV